MERPRNHADPAVDTRIDCLCDDFETAWKSGRRPSLEDFLQRAPSESQQALLQQLVLLEIDLRQQAGEAVDLAEYCRRFPAFADALRELGRRLETNDSQTVEQLLRRFGHAWQSGPSPRLEEFLDQAPAAERSRLLSVLLSEELRCRVAAGQAPSREEYLTRFPDRADCIGAVFDQFRLASQDSSRSGSFAETVNPSESGGMPAPPADEIAPPPAVENPPPQLARYRIRRQIGNGAFGTVWLADDQELQRQVAIKMPRPNQVSSEESVAAFLHEARTAAALNHADIVTIYDLGRLDDGGCFVVMEYIEGRSLADELKTGRVGFERAAGLMAETAEAMHYAHRQGFVHRDLKPANILLDAGGRPHIADFGVALHEDQQRDRAGEVSGTLPYMSPEQIKGAAHHLDGRSDIWSAGVVLYELLTGRRPFEGNSQAEFADEIRHRQPKPLRMIDDTIPAELERITLKCLEKEVNRRYATARDLAHDLRAWSAQQAPPEYGRRFVLAGVSTALFSLGLLAAVLVGLPPYQENRGNTPAPRNNDAQLENATGEAQQTAAATGDPDGPGVDAPLAINAFRILHYRDAGSRSELLGELGDQGAEIREHDAVRVEAEFNQPAYCFLLAFNPNGSVQPCHPEDAAAPPALLKQLSYPADPTDAFYLDDGAGEQAFGLIVSRQPLPAFADWQQAAGKSVPWQPVEPTTFMKIEQPLVTPLDHTYNTRGAVKKRPGAATVEHLDRFLRAHSSAASVITVGFPVWPERSPPDATTPLRVLSIDVEHFKRVSEREASPQGLLGKQSFAPRLGDQVTVEARLLRPAYAYLVAFRPDGVVELCFPDDESQPPPLTDRPRYPAPDQADIRYGLTDGAGLSVFAVVASDEPLPGYREYISQHKPDWSPQPASAGTVWWYDGQSVEALTGERRGSKRGKGEAALRLGGEVVRAATSLKTNQIKTAAAIGFGVAPSE